MHDCVEHCMGRLTVHPNIFADLSTWVTSGALFLNQISTSVKECMTANKSATTLRDHMSAVALTVLSWTVIIEVAVVSY